MNEDVKAWMKRLNRKAPFYLLKKETLDHDHEKFCYHVIWNDGDKTKIGTLIDGMSTRYGVNTYCVLNGDSVFDLWNGHCLVNADNDFREMLAVRNHKSFLIEFNLSELKDLRF